jgi:hypothetical protein
LEGTSGGVYPVYPRRDKRAAAEHGCCTLHHCTPRDRSALQGIARIATNPCNDTLVHANTCETYSVAPPFDVPKSHRRDSRVTMGPLRRRLARGAPYESSDWVQQPQWDWVWIEPEVSRAATKTSTGRRAQWTVQRKTTVNVPVFGSKHLLLSRIGSAYLKVRKTLAKET